MEKKNYRRNQNRQNKGKGRQRAKRVIELGSIVEWATQKIVEECLKTWFIVTWTPTTIPKVGEHFQYDFQTCFQTNLCKYMGVNLGCTTWVQQ